MVFGNCGVLRANNLANKAYVEMSTIDPETSNDIAEGVRQCNGRYLEVQVSIFVGGKKITIDAQSLK